MTRRWAAVLTVVALGALVGCGDDDDGTGDGAGPTTQPTESSEPAGVIAIGHSALTGEGSDPTRPGVPVFENSWATGSNPEVNSVYRRLAAVHPETEGHVANAASGGAPASALVRQAKSALAEVPAPELVIIQTIDADILCDGTDESHMREFRRSVADALEVVSAASPESHILIVSQPGRPATEAPTIPPGDRAALGGTGICDLFDPAGNINDTAVATLTDIIEGYEAEQARACAGVPLCSTDDGAMTSFVPEPGFKAADHDHNTVAGNARLAELIWPIVERVLDL